MVISFNSRFPPTSVFFFFSFANFPSFYYACNRRCLNVYRAQTHTHTQREEERRGKRDVCMLVHIWCDKKFVLNVIEHEAAHIRSSISCFVRSFVCRMALRSIVLFAMHFPNWANWLTEHMNVPMWELMFVYFAFVQNAFDSMEHQMHEKLFLSYRLMLILMLELWLHWSIHYYHPT